MSSRIMLLTLLLKAIQDDRHRAKMNKVYSNEKEQEN